MKRGLYTFGATCAKVAGIGILQDPIEYQSYTWHTNLDTYERVVEDDVQKSAIVIAAAAYHLAMRDELLPRLAPDEMPEPPAEPERSPPAKTQAEGPAPANAG